MKKKINKKWVIIVSLSLNITGILLFFVWSYKNPTKMLDIAFPGRTINIVMFGNSLTEGSDWTSNLKRIDVHNSGKGGFVTRQLKGIVRSHVINYKPKICFIEGGINDIGNGFSTKETVENFKSIVDSLKANNIIPVLSLTVYQHNREKTKNKIDSINVLVKKYAIDNKIDYFDLNEKLSANRSLKAKYTTDGTHLTKEAYPIWTEEVNKVLEKYNL
jgi:lysophospholipase L1-like esterase